MSTAAAASCRSCNRRGLEIVLDLGETPLADRLVSPADADRPDPTAPLQLAFCPDCALVQITETVAPEILFDAEYPYFASVSDARVAVAREQALELLESRRLDASSLVVEIASNDGYLLRNFTERNIPAIGIDPAAQPAAAARSAGIDTRLEFFGEELACRMREAGEQADVIVADNVLAHVADLQGLVRGMAHLLASDGAISIEVPYVIDLVEQCEFDTIYHQHLCYFSVTALDTLFRRHGLFLNEVTPIPIHGGSLRLLIEHRDDRDKSVERYLDTERRSGATELPYYRQLAKRAERVKHQLAALIGEIRGRGHRVVGYGAAAKGTTLLSYCGIGSESLDYVVDRNSFKHGKLMPGNRLPIEPVERLIEDQPEYVLLMVWNFADEVLSQQQMYRTRGGRFIVPIPLPKVIDAP